MNWLREDPSILSSNKLGTSERRERGSQLCIKTSCLEYRLSGLDGGWRSAPSNRCVVSEHRWVLKVHPQPQSLSRVPSPYLEFPFRYFHLKSNRHLNVYSMFKTESIFSPFFVQTYTFSSAPSLTELLSHFPYLPSLQSWKFQLIPFSAPHLYWCWLLTDSQLLHTDVAIIFFHWSFCLHLSLLTLFPPSRHCQN